MDSKTPEILVVSSTNVDLDGAVNPLIIPLFESLSVTAFGFLCTDTADANAAVVKLQVVESDGTTTQDLSTCTGTTGSDIGVNTYKKCDVLVDTVLNRAHKGDASATPLVPGGSRVWAWLQVKVTSNGDANSNGRLWVRFRKSGRPATRSAGEIASA
jgi:hypothetical protein